MAITETYMDAGDFSVAMGIETPHLMATVQRGGYLVITPQYLGDPRGYTDAALLAAARYTGIVLETEWRNGVLTLEGAGLDWLLGNLNGQGWPSPSVVFTGAALTTVIALISGGGIIPPIFTIGTVTNSTSYTATHDPTETVKQVIKQAIAAAGANYKIQPNFAVDAGPVTDGGIFTVDPEIVMVRDGWGSDTLYTGVPVIELSSSRSLREWLTTHLPELRAPNGTLIVRENVDTVDPLDQPVGGEIITNEIITDWAQMEQAGGAAGDVVYIYDPGSGFVGGSADRIWFRGRRLQPVAHRIVESEWEIIDGMGVYYRPHSSMANTDTWVDLTPTVATVPAASATSYLRTLDLSAMVENCL